MEAKDVKTLMEAYASVYEGYGKKKKGDCVSKSEKGDHNCAKKVCSEQWGEGETIFGQHAVPDENGFVSHYDVQFEHGIVENVSVEDMDILTMESHNEHVEHEGDTIDEMKMSASDKPSPKPSVMNAPKKKPGPMNGKYPMRQTEGKPAGGYQLPRRTPENAKNAEYYKDDVDLFDIIKGHLIDEGFADTEEAAHSIMVSMSEGWKQSIVEGYGSMIGSAVSAAAGALKNRMQSGTKRTGNINLPKGGPTKPKSRGEDIFTSTPPGGKPYGNKKRLPKPGTPAARNAPMRDEPLF